MPKLFKYLILFFLIPFAVFSQQKTTAIGVKLIKTYEGLRKVSYRCPANVWTIGYGSTGSHVVPGMVITEYEAEILLVKDLIRFEKYVIRSTVRFLKWNEFDALISLTFNVGYRLNVEFRNIINSGNTVVVIYKIKQYNRARIKGVLVVLPGLVRRRNSESILYQKKILKF